MGGSTWAMSTKKYLQTTLTRTIATVSIFSLFLPYFAFAQGASQSQPPGTSKIGDTCIENENCVTNTCEQKKDTDKKYCVCNATVGKETIGAEQCAVRYSSLDSNPGSWQCEQGIGGSYDLNYCQNQNTDQSQAPAGTTGGSSWWELITDTTAAVQFNAEELNKLLKKPSLRINIPGVSFTDTKSLPIRTEGDASYIYIPYIGEYIAPVYKYGILAIAVIAMIMIINAGFTWVTSGGSSEGIGKAQKGIVQAIIGLLIAVTSYSLLYLINPELVNFRSLRIQVVESDPLPTADSNDEDPQYVLSHAEASQQPPAGAKNTYDFTVTDPENFCFPVGDGFYRNENNWGQSRERFDQYTLCHQGVDLLTLGTENRGTVVSMTDGIVRRVTKNFYTCKDGKTDTSNPGEAEDVGMIEIYDKAHNMLYVYGEVNTKSIQLEKDVTVKKGQIIGKASKCKMLHLEIYKGSYMNRGKVPSTVLGNTVKANWLIYDSLNLPPLTKGKNVCMISPYIDIIEATGSKLQNPMPLLEQIKNNSCSS